MTTRTLHCQSGNHSWERERQGGRIPKDCPEHREVAERAKDRNDLGVTPMGTVLNPRTVPVKVVEGSESGDVWMTPDERAQRLTERMGRLHAISERKVIARE